MGGMLCIRCARADEERERLHAQILELTQSPMKRGGGSPSLRSSTSASMTSPVW